MGHLNSKISQIINRGKGNWGNYGQKCLWLSVKILKNYQNIHWTRYLKDQDCDWEEDTLWKRVPCISASRWNVTIHVLLC